MLLLYCMSHAIIFVYACVRVSRVRVLQLYGILRIICILQVGKVLASCACARAHVCLGICVLSDTKVDLVERGATY